MYNCQSAHTLVSNIPNDSHMYIIVYSNSHSMCMLLLRIENQTVTVELRGYVRADHKKDRIIG